MIKELKDNGWREVDTRGSLVWYKTYICKDHQRRTVSVDGVYGTGLAYPRVMTEDDILSCEFSEHVQIADDRLLFTLDLVEVDIVARMAGGVE